MSNRISKGISKQDEMVRINKQGMSHKDSSINKQSISNPGTSES
jgi:hypothetical protein